MHADTHTERHTDTTEVGEDDFADVLAQVPPPEHRTAGSLADPRKETS